MTHWTPTAEGYFRDYVTRLYGAASDDLADDLRRHVHEELSKKGIMRPTATDLGPILLQLAPSSDPIDDPSLDGSSRKDSPALSDDASSPAQLTEAELYPTIPVALEKQSTQVRSQVSLMALIFGVLTPTVAIMVEIMSGVCGDVFFDPLPTGWHLLVCMLVPSCTLWLMWRQDRFLALERTVERRVVQVASGVGLMLAGYYAVCTIFWVPMALVGVIFGFGLIPLSVQSGWYYLWLQRRKLRQGLANDSDRDRAEVERAVSDEKRWRRISQVVGLVVLLALEGPSVLGQVGVWANQSAAAWTRKLGMSCLRAPGVAETLLAQCYGTGRGVLSSHGSIGTEVWSWVMGNSFGVHHYRDLYYRVTGRAYSSGPPPKGYDAVLIRSGLKVNQDWGRAGDEVGIRLNGLDMVTSRFDVHASTSSRLVYTEWTVEFQNDSAEAEEARMQVQLPPGGVVSRLTLWVNGTPQEAAYGSVQQVKAAYRDVVMVKQRDPVMVNYLGPDRVMVQCFPVPRDHGTIKFRIGMTAPFAPDADGHLAMPRVIERNFGYGQSLNHSIWVQGKGQLTSGVPAMTAAKEGAFSGLHIEATPAQLASDSLFLQCKMSALPPVVWAKDALASGEDRLVIGRWKSVQDAAQSVAAISSGPTIVVLDGGKSLETMRPAITEALRPHLAGVKLILASAAEERALSRRLAGRRGSIDEETGDEVANAPGSGSAAVRNDELDAWECLGGVDNSYALLEAFSQASNLSTEKSLARIIWIHGPQPIELVDSSALMQFLERSFKPARLIDVGAVLGPNRILEKIGLRSWCQSGPQLGPNFLPQLNALLAPSAHASLTLQNGHWVTERSPEGSPIPDGAVEVWDHLARYAAYGDVLEAWRSGSTDPKWAAMATAHQLVTPVSSAVVLETKEQFVKNGLEQADPSVVPSIPVAPEPSSALLLAMGSAFLFGRRRSRAGERSRRADA